MEATLIERIREKIDTSGGPEACHPWTGGFGQYGGPSCYVTKGRSASARRKFYEHHQGTLPRTRHVYTTCGRKDCMNIGHLTTQPVDDPVARFWKNVKRATGDGCWTWTGTRSKTGQRGSYHRGAGYGHFMVADQKRVQAHRYSWELHFGPIPAGMVVCHRCDNPTCVRPDHLWLGTHKDNVHDMIRKGRQSAGAEHGRRVAEARATPREPFVPGVQNNLKRTPEVTASIVDAARRGLSRRENAKLHGVGVNTIYRALVAAGVKKPRDKAA